MRIDFTAEDIPEHHRFEAWHATILSALSITAEQLPGAEQPFRGRFTARTNGPLLNCAFDTDGFRAVRRSSEIARRRWDGYWIYREYGTGAWFNIGGQELVSKPGDIIIGDADAVFETRPADRFHHELWLAPKPLVDPHLPVLGRPLVTRLSGGSGVNALAAAYLDTLTRNWNDISEAEMGPVTEVLCRLIGVACGAEAGAHAASIRSGRLVEAKRYIDYHLADPDLSPTSVAAALGISLRALHLMFEPTGTSFARTVMRRRLEECRAALLSNPARSVTDIAFAWGFNNLSTFYRAFQAAFGMVPGDLRSAASAPIAAD